MSVKIMSMIFEADIPDLDYYKDGQQRKAKASTCTLMLLAYADHANDEGEGAYPGYTRLERKTKLSRQGVADTLEALRQNEFLALEGISKLETNSYKLNIEAIKELVKPLDYHQSSHLTTPSQATRLKPSFNHPLTSNDNEQTEGQNIFKLYEQNIGVIAPMLIDDMKAAEQEYPYEWIVIAFKIAVENNARNWKYISKVLKNMKSNGVDWKPGQDKKPAAQAKPEQPRRPKVRKLSEIDYGRQ